MPKLLGDVAYPRASLCDWRIGVVQSFGASKKISASITTPR